MKFYYVYILLCSDNTYYTGMTNNLERRISQHKSGYRKDSYTYSRLPIELKWYLQCTNSSEAIKIEKQIKGWSQRKKNALINENWKDLIKFSKNYTDYGHPNKQE
ncbi:GIY-YIG nuclease family protein [Flavivirga rizhaonensis]|uniref:GIY-YIG nuclease family protein n=1 Tax=Flavivirga rizhaonensis TaxID=2559571 RepID=A0A4S1DVK1_9FLAO|nr:GIY-YIG nuclease family protein [Flavivirga rizhaonensis]TGV02181.1 GIY-YIG nuclease family protein [Flavivirga rizhaonensis]